MTENKSKKSGLEFEVPEGWRVVQLGKVSKVTSGGTPSREIKSYWGGEIPWVTTSLIDFNEIEKADEFITQEGLKNSAAKIFPSGTILMALYGQGVTRGKTALLKIDASTNQACAAIIPDLEKIEKKYLFQYLISIYSKIRGLSNTGNQENLNGELVKSIKIPLPPLPEQRTIAQVLGKMDEAIQTTERLIAQKELRKKWLMQHLLTGKMRLKGFSGEWKEVKFGSFLKESRIKGNTGAESKKITVKLYGKGVYAKEEKSIGSTNTQYFTRRSGQFIYSKLDFLNGAFGIIPDVLNGFESTLDLPCFDILDSKMNKFFLLFFVSREGFYKKYDDGAIGGRKAKRIQVNEFLNIKPKLPLLEEQTAIARVLQTADQEINLLKAKADKLREQKKGMMQVLLTGKVRLKIN